MADFFNIVDAQVDPDAPLTSELAYAWRDNPIAIAQGTPGAPGIWVSGLQKPSVGEVVKYEQTNTVQIPTEPTARSLSSTTVFTGWGAVRVRLGAYRNSLSGGSITFSRGRGSTISTISSYNLTGTYTEYSLDFDHMPLDRLVITVVGVTQAGAFTLISGHKMLTSGDDLWLNQIGGFSGSTYNMFWNTP